MMLYSSFDAATFSLDISAVTPRFIQAPRYGDTLSATFRLRFISFAAACCRQRVTRQRGVALFAVLC